MIFFGTNLIFLRTKKGFTIKQIAENLDFTRSQWNNYETGISYPKFLDLIKIAKYFDIGESELIHQDLNNVVYSKKNSTPTPVDEVIVDYNNWQKLAEEREYTIQMQKQVIENLQQELKQHKKTAQSTIPDVLHQSTR